MCGRRDLNPYASEGATPSRWCVCQFRHFRIVGTTKIADFSNLAKPYPLTFQWLQWFPSLFTALVMHCIDRIFANLLNPFKQTPHGIEEYIVKKSKSNTRASIPLSIEELIRDLTLAIESRQASLLGRREVLSGKAKFGILVMERNFHNWHGLMHSKKVISDPVIIVTKHSCLPLACHPLRNFCSVICNS